MKIASNRHRLHSQLGIFDEQLTNLFLLLPQLLVQSTILLYDVRICRLWYIMDMS